MRSRIAGLGHHAPARRVPNAEIEQWLGLTPGWIEQRTGVRERRYVASDEAVTDLAVQAGKMALEAAGMAPSEVGLVLLATSTPDHLLPPSGPLLAYRLGCDSAGAMDLAGACSGFVYAATLADGFVRAQGRPALVVAANVLSRRINPDDRASSVLFADAAGAMLLEPAADEACGVEAAHLSSQGAHYELIKIEAGGSRRPFTEPGVTAEDCAIRISDGRSAFAAAIESMISTSQAVLQAAGQTVEAVDWWVPHQANLRIIEAAGRRLGIAPEKTLLSIADYGNSSAATIPFTLSLKHSEGMVRPDARILATAVGAGFTEGALLLRL